MSDNLNSQPCASVRLIASAKTWIEGSAVEQLKKTATLPGMHLAVGLPDLHPGKGSPIGAAFLTTNTIYPYLVGNDIGCGIALFETSLGAQKPKRETWASRLQNLDEPWDGDPAAFLAERKVEATPHDAALGTIGSGNHFAELQAIESIVNPALAEKLNPEAVYLCVHSGSRGLGEAILRRHTDIYAAGGLVANTTEAAQYLAQHNHAVNWAAANRSLIAHRIFDCLNAEGQPITDTCHNSVTPVEGRWLHRKGAAPATAGPVIIPGSRGAHTYLVQPKEPRVESAWSLAHGAGRKWSRTDSRARLEKRYTAKQLARTELGSTVICENKDLLYEEAPQAYKNITSVIEDLVNANLIDVIAILKPLITYKVRRHE